MNNLLKQLAVSFLLLTCMKSIAAITSFSEDYEGLAVASGEPNLELAILGWRRTGLVFDGITLEDGSDYRGTYWYFYGWQTPSNTHGEDWALIQNEDADHSGATTNYINFFSDYNNANAHANSPNSVNAILAKEFVIDANEIGKNITFTFDAKRPKVNDYGLGDNSNAVGNGCSFTCTAGAFLKTIDPSNNYSQTNYITLDTSSISQSSWETFSISLDLSEPLLEGQLLQVGFENFATNFDNTGVYYDNVNLEISEVPLPAGIYLFLSGLVGLGFTKSKRKVSNFK